MHFYCDYELYQNADPPSDPSDPPDVVAISSFPTNHISGYAASFTSVQYDFTSNNYISFTECPNSYGSIGFYNENYDNQDKNENDNEGMIETEQVKSFWALYNEYPAYLKKAKKRNRNRRRGKKCQ